MYWWWTRMKFQEVKSKHHKERLTLGTSSVITLFISRTKLTFYCQKDEQPIALMEYTSLEFFNGKLRQKVE